MDMSSCKCRNFNSTALTEDRKIICVTTSHSFLKATFSFLPKHLVVKKILSLDLPCKTCRWLMFAQTFGVINYFTNITVKGVKVLC